MNTAKTLSLVMCSMLLYPAAGLAQQLTMADLKDPQKLAGDELRQLLTGSKVQNKTSTGSTRRWENNPDGKFVASTDSLGYQGSTTARPSSGRGSWHISPLDQYCVTIEWRTTAENWCYFVFKSGDKFYGTTRQGDPSVRVAEFEFKK